MAEIIRPATRADSERLNDIYNLTIVDSHVSFTVEPWTLEKRLVWWDERPDDLPALVAERDGLVIGLAVGSRFRPKAAYRTSVETTIVLDEGTRGRGLGTRLLGALVEELAARGFHRAVAHIALPNDASIALHHKLGYRTVGVLTEVGHKLGRFWDVATLEREL